MELDYQSLQPRSTRRRYVRRQFVPFRKLWKVTEEEERRMRAKEAKLLENRATEEAGDGDELLLQHRTTVGNK
jgi:hypothetical protein